MIVAKRILLAAAAAMSMCAPAKAITYSTYYGTISSFTDYSGSLGAFYAGEPVVLRYAYDPRVNRDQRVLTFNSLIHNGAGALSPVTGAFTIGGSPFVLAPTYRGQFALFDIPVASGGDDWSNQVIDQRADGNTLVRTSITSDALGGNFIHSLDPNISFDLALKPEDTSFSSAIRLAYFEAATGSFLREEYVHFAFNRLNVEYVFAPDVPEPTNWALMVGGFGLAGAAVRRGKQSRAATV